MTPRTALHAGAACKQYCNHNPCWMGPPGWNANSTAICAGTAPYCKQQQISTTPAGRPHAPRCMPGRNAVLRLEVWNSLRPVGFILLYSLCGGAVQAGGSTSAREGSAQGVGQAQVWPGRGGTGEKNSSMARAAAGRWQPACWEAEATRLPGRGRGRRGSGWR